MEKRAPGAVDMFDGIEIHAPSLAVSSADLRTRLHEMQQSDPVALWLLEPIRVFVWQQLRGESLTKHLYSGRVVLQRRLLKEKLNDGVEIVPLKTQQVRTSGSGKVNSADVALQSMSRASNKSMKASNAGTPLKTNGSGRSTPGKLGSSQHRWVSCSPDTCSELLKDPKRSHLASDSPWSTLDEAAASEKQAQPTKGSRSWAVQNFQFDKKLHSVLLDIPNPHHYEYSFLYQPGPQALTASTALGPSHRPCRLRSRTIRFQLPVAKLYEPPALPTKNNDPSTQERDTRPLWGNALDIEYACFAGSEHRSNCVLVLDDLESEPTARKQPTTKVEQLESAIQFSVSRSVTARDAKQITATSVGNALKDFFSGASLTPGPSQSKASGTPGTAADKSRPRGLSRGAQQAVPAAGIDWQDRVRAQILGALPRAKNVFSILGIAPMQSDARACVVIQQEKERQIKSKREKMKELATSNSSSSTSEPVEHMPVRRSAAPVSHFTFEVRTMVSPYPVAAVYSM